MFFAVTEKLQQRTKKSKASPQSCTGARPTAPGFMFVNLHKGGSAAPGFGSVGVAIIIYNHNISGKRGGFLG